jgi:hypothetical protein
MKFYNYSYLIGLVVLACSCKSENNSKAKNFAFKVTQITIEADTTVKSIAYLNDYLICLQDNDSLIVFDTSYKRCPTVETKLNKTKIDYLFTYRDTVFLVSKNKKYFLNPEFSLTLKNSEERFFSDALYNDSAYLIYGCCMGEFGGAIFFSNKHTQKTYSYMATCATQVLKFKDAYVVCNNLAHLGRGMDFLIVTDPTKLYELKEDSLKNFCNWYVNVDSLKDYWRSKPKVPIVVYSGSYNSMSLITFPFEDSLYSILCNDSSVVLAVHRGDSTFTKQILLYRPLNYHEAQVICSKDQYACLFRLTSGSPFAAYLINGNDFGVAIVKNGMINILTRRSSK